VGFAFALMIGGMTMNILGLPLPSLGTQPRPFLSLVSSLIAGVLMGLTLGPLGTRLKLSLLGRACLWCLLLLVLSILINMIEAVFFTTIPPTQLARSGAIHSFGHIGVAVLLALLFRPRQTGPGLLTRLREALARRTAFSWVLRFGLASLTYLPIYYKFGMLVAPFVLPYYDNPDLGLNLTVPSIGVSCRERYGCRAWQSPVADRRAREPENTRPPRAAEVPELRCTGRCAAKKGPGVPPGDAHTSNNNLAFTLNEPHLAQSPADRRRAGFASSIIGGGRS
jgi:hypothetical protein